MHFYPHAGCDYRGWLGLGNIRANGHPSGGPWRQLYCRSCQRYFLETHGTLFHGKRLSVELIVRVLACLAKGLGIRATARVFEVDPNTVLQWLVAAAEHLKSIGKSNGLFHRPRPPTLSPTLHHRVPPPGARAPARPPGRPPAQLAAQSRKAQAAQLPRKSRQHSRPGKQVDQALL